MTGSHTGRSSRVVGLLRVSLPNTERLTLKGVLSTRIHRKKTGPDRNTGLQVLEELPTLDGLEGRSEDEGLLYREALDGGEARRVSAKLKLCLAGDESWNLLHSYRKEYGVETNSQCLSSFTQV